MRGRPGEERKIDQQTIRPALCGWLPENAYHECEMVGQLEWCEVWCDGQLGHDLWCCFSSILRGKRDGD